MIEEVVNSILEAEDVAKRRIEQAEAQAAEIVSNAEQDASAYKKQQATLSKKQFADKMKTADELSEQKASARLAELNAETDKQISTYAKNVDKAVKIILEAN